ncbi:hypothetical protein [Ralstonia pseudosolanacearum]|uniref:hypothetical protein n=1 Tax=Ralstonia pseudosolanacearum TaxID=1310165 RepID=UPI003CEB72EA
MSTQDDEGFENSVPDQMGTSARHSVDSVLRERIIEHVFVGDVLRRMWQLGVTDIEVLRSEFDAGGYDLVLGHKKILRHLQMKSSIQGGRSESVPINLKLAQKPSGCILWIVVDDDLEFRSYRWLGGEPGQPLPDLSHHPDAKQTRANAQGEKRARVGHKAVPRRAFEDLETLDAVLKRLFGSLQPQSETP